MDEREFSELPEDVKQAIAALERLGYPRKHLVVGTDQNVLFDPELSTRGHVGMIPSSTRPRKLCNSFYSAGLVLLRQDHRITI